MGQRRARCSSSILSRLQCKTSVCDTVKVQNRPCVSDFYPVQMLKCIQKKSNKPKTVSSALQINSTATFICSQQGGKTTRANKFSSATRRQRTDTELLRNFNTVYTHRCFKISLHFELFILPLILTANLQCSFNLIPPSCNTWRKSPHMESKSKSAKKEQPLKPGFKLLTFLL